MSLETFKEGRHQHNYSSNSQTSTPKPYSALELTLEAITHVCVSPHIATPFEETATRGQSRADIPVLLGQLHLAEPIPVQSKMHK